MVEGLKGMFLPLYTPRDSFIDFFAFRRWLTALCLCALVAQAAGAAKTPMTSKPVTRRMMNGCGRFAADAPAVGAPLLQ